MSDFDPIWIECTIRRPNGSRVMMNEVLGDEETPEIHYHFKPLSEDDPRHVALVGNESHAQRFLSITNAYRFAKAPANLPETAEGMGATVSPAPEPTPEPDPTPVAKASEGADDETPSEEPTGEKPLTELSREELEATFEREVGRTANARAKDETLIAIIETTREEKG